MSKVRFFPSGKTVDVPAGNTILEAAIAAGEELDSTCGGRGTCGKCKVKLPSPSIINPSDIEKRFLRAEELAEGWVLACQYTLDEDTDVELARQRGVYDRKIGPPKIEGFDSLAPSISKHFITVKKPDKANPTSDWELLSAALPFENVPFKRQVAASLPHTLRQGNYQVTVVMDESEILTVEPGDTRERSFGLAIDIGTTTIVAHLLDLNKGLILASAADTNPQQVFGADVISRITYAGSNSEGLVQLHRRVIKGLNGIIAKLCKNASVLPGEIYQGVVVGNTTMSHLFLGIDPTYLAPAPFTPAFRQMVEVGAGELGLDILRTGKVLVLPNVAGYVGADTVGVMLAAEVDRLQGISLIIDIGTNGEIILAGKKRIITCSTAAGPAFEGAEIKYGMRASQGAIEGVHISEDVELAIIASGKARGICGSGLIDAVAEMLRMGIIQPSGRMTSKADQLGKLPPLVSDRLREDQGVREFVLAWGKDTAIGEDIVLNQKDIRELQLAKGAILAGNHLLLQEMGIEYGEIDRVLLAGAFGNYIKKESARRIGLLPSIPLGKIYSIGNAAAEGAKLTLLSKKERERAVSLAKQAEHLELSGHEGFQQEFLRSLSFDDDSK